MSAGDRKDLLREAEQYVTKDRNSAYGEPEDNFSAIAEVWNAQGLRIDGRCLNATDVALLMMGMKLARLRHNPSHRDSWVDTAGYAACGWDTVKPASPFADAPNHVHMHLPEFDPGALKAAFNGNGKRGCAEAEESVTEVYTFSFTAVMGFPQVQHIDDTGKDVPLNASGSNIIDLVDEVNKKIAAEHEAGWVSNNRCGKSGKTHGAHRYSSGSRGFDAMHGGQWCDGWRDVTMPDLKSDVETIKRVADKHPTRPIKDNPQA